MGPVPITEAIVFTESLEYIMYKDKILMQFSQKHYVQSLSPEVIDLFLHMLYFLPPAGSVSLVVSTLCI